MKAKAVFITRDSNDDISRLWNAKIGISKIEGCVEYWSPWEDEQQGFGNVSHMGILDETECIAKYGSFPASGEAWLVRPTKHYWMWERVDHKMALLDSDGEAIAYKHRVKVMRLK